MRLALALPGLVLAAACGSVSPFGGEDGGAGGAPAGSGGAGGGAPGSGGMVGTGGAPGSGGALGSGGTVGSGGAVGPAGSGGAGAALKAQYKNDDPINAQWSAQSFNIINGGAAAVSLSAVVARYWFDADGRTLTPPPVCNSAFIVGCSNVALAYRAVAPARPGATHYLEIGFTVGAGELAPGHQTGTVQTSFHYDNFFNVNRTNDYSFDQSAGQLSDSRKVTVYVGGVLVWGVEPS